MKIFKNIKKFLLSVLGDIKVYKYPFFIIYDPGSYKVKGEDIEDALKLLRPGDLILRKYIHYLDGYFIPGAYSHTGIYVGNGKIIHAVAEGVSEISVIDFLKCDGFCILRQDSYQLADYAVEYAKGVLKMKGEYDFDFKSDNESWYCHELGALAYKAMNISKKSTKILGIKLEPRYLAESFLEDERFHKILEV